MADANEKTDENQIAEYEPTERDMHISDILHQVAEVTGVDVGTLSRVEVTPGELSITRWLPIQHGEDDAQIRVVDSVPFTYVPAVLPDSA